MQLRITGATSDEFLATEETLGVETGYRYLKSHHMASHIMMVHCSQVAASSLPNNLFCRLIFVDQFHTTKVYILCIQYSITTQQTVSVTAQKTIQLCFFHQQVPVVTDLKVVVISSPGDVTLEEPFQITCLVTNTR